MKNAKYALTVTLLSIVITACSMKQHSAIEPPNGFNAVEENLLTGAQPTEANLVQLKMAGITKVINLRAPDEKIPFDEKAKVESLGLEYISFPISGAAGITSENARKLDALLEGDEKVLVHCASGNRVGALIAIRAHEVENKPEEESLRLGRAAGLGSLEETVKSHLAK